MRFRTLSKYEPLVTPSQIKCGMYGLSHVWFSVTPWTIICPAPLSMRFSRQESWNGLPFPSLGDLSDHRLNPWLLNLLKWQVDSLPLVPPGKPLHENMVPRNTVAFKIHLFLTRLAAKFPSETMKVRRQQNDIFKVLTMKNLISKKKKKTFKNEDEIHSPNKNKQTKKTMRICSWQIFLIRNTKNTLSGWKQVTPQVRPAKFSLVDDKTDS